MIIQLMPGTSDEIIDQLEAKIGTISSITSMLDQGMNPEAILEYVLGDFGLEILDRMPVQFHCNCSKERVARAIASISKEELGQMIEEGKPIEVNCQFCNSHYLFDTEELKAFL